MNILGFLLIIALLYWLFSYWYIWLPLSVALITLTIIIGKYISKRRETKNPVMLPSQTYTTSANSSVDKSNPAYRTIKVTEAKKQLMLSGEEVEIFYSEMAPGQKFVINMYEKIYFGVSTPAANALFWEYQKERITHKLYSINGANSFVYKIDFHPSNKAKSFERVKDDYSLLNGAFYFNQRFEPDYKIHNEYKRYADKDMMWFGFAIMVANYWKWVEDTIDKSHWLDGLGNWPVKVWRMR